MTVGVADRAELRAGPFRSTCRQSVLARHGSALRRQGR